MALERKDRVKDYTTTTGTGAVNLGGTAPAGFRTFNAAITSGATVRYLIESNDSSEWEVGEGVFTASPDTLTRVAVYASSNANALVNFSAGTKSVGHIFSAQDVSDLTPTNSWVNQETPSGTINGSNAAFTLANIPVAGTVAVFLNGQQQTLTDDYGISVSTITFVSAPLAGDVIRVSYFLSGAASMNAATFDGASRSTDGALSANSDLKIPTEKAVKTYVDRIKFNPASSAAPASMDFFEDTDNGTNKINLKAPDSISSDKTITFPDETGTLLTSATPVSNAFALAVMSALNPVGTIREFNVATNPGTLLGFGTWTAFGTGRVTVAIDAGQTEFDANGETGGAKTNTVGIDPSGARTSYYGGVVGSTGFAPGADYAQGSHDHPDLSISTLQPYIVVYRWVRTV